MSRGRDDSSWAAQMARRALEKEAKEKTEKDQREWQSYTDQELTN